LIVGYSWGSVWYCLDHVPDGDLGEPVTLGELPSPLPRCETCGKALGGDVCA
jgi:hypothetical protein